jgi:hypothetical protein
MLENNPAYHLAGAGKVIKPINGRVSFNHFAGAGKMVGAGEGVAIRRHQGSRKHSKCFVPKTGLAKKHW